MSNPIDTVDDVIARLPKHDTPILPPPAYAPTNNYNCRLGLAVASMKEHMTDEGWQIFNGLAHNGYKLCGYQLNESQTNLHDILRLHNPATLVVQDKREWDISTRDFRETRAHFKHIEVLKDRSDIFRLTIIKDAQQRPQYHSQSAVEIGCNAWICYYHPKIVHHLAPYTRPQHLVRTYHTLDPVQVPEYSSQDRKGCFLSGAISGAYPLRTRLVKSFNRLLETKYHSHPGYHRNGCQTPTYLKLLSKYKIAICTASMYGYALRKIIEATACGCRVITNLPSDEVLPGIDGNLIRVSNDISLEFLNDIIRNLCTSYDPEFQRQQAEIAIKTYDYKLVTAKLAEDIAAVQKSYSQ